MSGDNHETVPMLNTSELSDDTSRIHINKYKNFSYKTQMGSRKHVVGAMRIMSRWPDHWLPSTGYWWIGAAVLCLLILALYNNVLAMSMMPAHQVKHEKITKRVSQKESYLPVSMHTIENTNFFSIDKYLPYIEELMYQFPKCKYNFIVLINDTNGSEYRLKSDGGNNNDKIMIADGVRDITNGINVMYLSLSRYLDESPINKRWREIPSRFIPFLVRAVSVWDKSGIAFNPNVLLPSLLKYEYMNKLKDVIQKYGKIHATNYEKERKTMFNTHRKAVNSIQDIINELENEDNMNCNEINLNEEESKIMRSYSKKVASDKIKKAAQILTEKRSKLEKIFNDEPKYAVIINPNDTGKEFVKDMSDKDVTKPIEIPRFIKMVINPNMYKVKNNESVNFSIDLNGNILATDTPCHAFLGMLFSTQNYKEITLTDFIIKELTIFCNGLLSTCKNISVIFV